MHSGQQPPKPIPPEIQLLRSDQRPSILDEDYMPSPWVDCLIRWFVIIACTAIVVGAMVLAMCWGVSAKAADLATLGKWGFPEGTVRQVGEFALADDGRTRCPRWVMEVLDADTLAGHAERRDRFHPDPLIPAEFRASLEDYQGSDFDRGHLAPCADFGQQRAMDATFALSNMVPQPHAFNAGIWKRLESVVRPFGDIPREWVLSCPLWLPDDEGAIYVKPIGKGLIWPPTHCGKAVLQLRGKQTKPTKLAAWILPNRKAEPTDTLYQFQVSVDEFERASGLDVWNKLESDLQDSLEGEIP